MKLDHHLHSNLTLLLLMINRSDLKVILWSEVDFRNENDIFNLVSSLHIVTIVWNVPKTTNVALVVCDTK